MSQNQPIQQNNGSAQPQVAPLDPSVVALTKGIGKAESPNFGTPDAYNNIGDGGNSQGAYQMSTPFIQEYAPKILGSSYQAGQKLTPAQQDQLAYGVVKEWGTTGDPNYSYLGKLTPQQIASAWNSGDPNAYMEADYQGTKKNTQGESYNVPDYVSNVENAYNSIMGTPTANAATSDSDNTSSGSGPGLLDTILAAGGAAGSWLLGKGWQYAQKPLEDAATDAAVAGTVGLVTGPGALPMAAAGGIEGLTRGIVSDFTGNGNSSAPATSTDQTQTTQPAQPDVSSEVVADAGKANPLTPKPYPQPQNNQQSEQEQQPQNNQQSEQEQQDQAEIQKLEAEMPQANQASQKVAQQMAQDYGTTISGQRKMDDPNVKEGIQEAGINGWGPNVIEDENGVKRNDYQEGIDKASGAIKETSENMGTMLDASGSRGSMKDTLTDAYKDFSMTSGIDAGERELAKKYMTEKGKAYLRESGDKKGTMSAGKFEKMKRELGHGKKWDQLEPNWKREADKSLSRAARRTVEKNLEPHMKDLYNRANKKMQRMINARNVMEKLDKKKGTKNKSMLKGLIHAGGRYAALYIGDKIGGPLGAILGSMAGDYITRAVDKKFGKTLFETPAMRKGLEILQKSHPKAYIALQNELKKAGVIKGKEDVKDSEKQNMKQDISDITSHPSSSPKQNKGQSQRKPKGKSHKGLIQLPKRPPSKK